MTRFVNFSYIDRQKYRFEFKTARKMVPRFDIGALLRCCPFVGRL